MKLNCTCFPKTEQSSTLYLVVNRAAGHGKQYIGILNMLTLAFRKYCVFLESHRAASMAVEDLKRTLC